MALDWKNYTTIAFIDSNVALECLALEQLPWREIDSSGSILVLVTPTVIQEVDSKKNHARLGDHARRFNRGLRPLLTDSSTVMIRSSPAPTVEVALADCAPIDWADFRQFDPNEADARVAVQAYSAKCPESLSRILISHDIRPLYLGRQLGMKVHQIGDGWLRPKEVSEAEKKAASLQRELNTLKSREPRLEAGFLSDKSTVATYRIINLTDQGRREIQDTIIALNPIPAQENSNRILRGLDAYDHTLDRRYARWESEVIPKFVDEYEGKLELNFGQVELTFVLKNIGQVPAEGILIKLKVTGGWLHDRYLLARPDGPRAPSVRQQYMNPMLGMYSRNAQRVQVGKHDFEVIEEPNRSNQVQIACEDFRHGYDYEYSVVAWVDPHADGLCVEATVTAANLHGAVRTEICIDQIPTDVTVSELVDLESMRFHQPPAVALLLKKALNNGDYGTVEIDGSNWDA